MAEERSTTTRISGSVILVIIGIVLAFLCLVGILVQMPTYIDNAGQPAPVIHADSGVTGPEGSFAQTLAAWAGSAAAAAETAYNLIVFFAIGIVVSLLLIWWGVKGIRKSRLAAEQAAQNPAPAERRRDIHRAAPHEPYGYDPEPEDDADLEWIEVQIPNKRF